MNQENSIKQKFQSFCDTIHNAGFNDKNYNQFDNIMEYVINHLCLVVGETRYRIVEAEVYYKSIKHPDPYTHGVTEQMTQGGWYFNGMGLDITFGRKANTVDENIYGGILIRGIRKLDGENNYISGVSNCLKAMFASIQHISDGRPSFYFVENENEYDIPKYEPVKSTRMGLTKKSDDEDNYWERPYRYIVELKEAHKFRQKEDVVKGLLQKGTIDLELAKEMLGYQLKSNS